MSQHPAQLGNYRLVSLLGKGGFADVYLGEHLYLHTKAAIKVLQTRLSNTDSSSFLNEARTIASLVHPNIIRVLDFGLEDTTPFLVMDYAPNGTLRQRFPKGVARSPQEILPYVQQVASALMYAHNQKVVHRDIKPENMLLGNNFEVLLSDFGIALVTQSSRYQGTAEVVGTAGYMAPEQLQGKPRAASDQYSLGIVVYEWLSGSVPFHGTFTEVASQHIFSPPPPLHQKIPSIPPDVEQVVMMALAKDPQQRFLNIQAFARAFEQACQSETPTIISAHLQAMPTLTPIAPTVQDTFIQPNPPSWAPEQLTQVANAPHAHEFTQLPNAPIVNYPTQAVPKNTSRRTFLFGAAGLAIVVVGGAAWLGWEQYSSLAAKKNLPTPLASQSSTTHTTPSAPGTTPTADPTSINTTPTPSNTLGTLIFTYRGHTGSVYADTWSPDGLRIASCAQDKTVQVWNALNGSGAFTYSGHTNMVYALSWSAQQLIASGGEDKTVQVWNANGGSNIFTYTNHSQPVYSVVWSPTGQRIASSSGDRTVQLWNGTTGGNVLTYSGHSDVVRTAIWSPDGSRVASGSEDKTVQVWNAGSGSTNLTYNGHTDGVLMLAWSPDGSLIASAGRDTTVRVWNASTGATLLVYRGHNQRVWGVSWSPDGKRIASGSKDGTVQIWDASTGRNVFIYRGHSDTVWDVPWSPDGQHIASSSNDSTVQVWRAT